MEERKDGSNMLVTMLTFVLFIIFLPVIIEIVVLAIYIVVEIATWARNQLAKIIGIIFSKAEKFFNKKEK